MNSRQLESLRFAADDLARNRQLSSIAGIVTLTALHFETCTDHDGETIYQFLAALETAVSSAASSFFNEEDD